MSVKSVRGKEASYEFHLQLASERAARCGQCLLECGGYSAGSTAANVATDTVQLTEAQQVYQLFNQGQSVVSDLVQPRTERGFGEQLSEHFERLRGVFGVGFGHERQLCACKG